MSAARLKPACLLDASIYVFRYYFAMPDHCFSQQGLGTGTVYGFTRFLLQFLLREQPEIMAACFDESLESGFRNQLYAGYKSSRALPDDALAFQLHACKEVTSLLGIRYFASDYYEADDLLGSLMTHLQREKPECAIALMTRDKDLGQLLIRAEDFLWDYHFTDHASAAPAVVSEIQQQRLFRQQIVEKFGVWPEQFVDYLALVGDSVDDIPGVPGIGAKTARALLQHADSIDGLFEQLSQVSALNIRGSKGLPEKLLHYRDQIALAQQLATVVTDIDMQLQPEDLLCQKPDRAAFLEFCGRMGLPAQLMHLFDGVLESK